MPERQIQASASASRISLTRLPPINGLRHILKRDDLGIAVVQHDSRASHLPIEMTLSLEFAELQKSLVRYDPDANQVFAL